ncbi:MAG TPA: hypothetical protein VHY83_13890 [Solirubrobacteraceae bacterium]|nr:hypothetical protein [Solirubrobacteraceae bacterium]
MWISLRRASREEEFEIRRHRRRQPRPALIAGLLGVGALFLAAMTAGPASATGSYPGETLSLSQSSPATVGQVVNFAASGQQSDFENYAGGFNLDIFQKPLSVDPTCSASDAGENNTWKADIANEFHPVVGLWQGPGQSFSVPFKIVPEHAGQMLLCGYSEWGGDTAAAGQLTVNVTTAGSGSGSTATPTATKPRVSRSGKTLTCKAGAFSGNPTHITYGWLVNGRRQGADHGRTLAVSGKLRGRNVQCSVSAANAAGKVTAVSSPYHVH